jgi:hypothetical protein
MWTASGFKLNNVPSILDHYFMSWCVSGPTFSEILRILENDWQLSPQFSEKVYLYYKLLGDMLMLLKNILGEPGTQLPILLREPLAQLSILLRDSLNLREEFTSKQHLPILRISENDYQLSPQFSNIHGFLVSGSPRNAACKSFFRNS